MLETICGWCESLFGKKKQALSPDNTFGSDKGFVVFDYLGRGITFKSEISKDLNLWTMAIDGGSFPTLVLQTSPEANACLLSIAEEGVDRSNETAVWERLLEAGALDKAQPRLIERTPTYGELTLKGGWLIYPLLSAGAQIAVRETVNGWMLRSPEFSSDGFLWSQAGRFSVDGTATQETYLIYRNNQDRYMWSVPIPTDAAKDFLNLFRHAKAMLTNSILRDALIEKWFRETFKDCRDVLIGDYPDQWKVIEFTDMTGRGHRLCGIRVTEKSEKTEQYITKPKMPIVSSTP